MAELELVGAIKVKDGLFIGDEFAAQDLEFVVANKVTHIINCASRQVPNHWEPIGVNYLSFYWLDIDSQVLFDTRDEVFSQIYSFIEEAANLGESVLVHSVRGQCRCICVVAAYFMKKYRWTLFKTLEFLNSRRSDMELRPNFVHQLAALEGRLTKLGFGPISSGWNDTNEVFETNAEDLVLRNTYLNAQVGEFVDYEQPVDIEKNDKISWIDNGTNENLADIPHPSSKNPVENGFAILRSCLKGAPQTEYREEIRIARREHPMQRSRGDNMNVSPIKSNDRIKSIVGASHDDLQKLADALHNDLMKNNENIDKAIKITEKKGGINEKNKRKVSPAKIGLKKIPLIYVGNRPSLKGNEDSNKKNQDLIQRLIWDLLHLRLSMEKLEARQQIRQLGLLKSKKLWGYNFT